MAWKLNSSEPIYLQLMSVIKSRIVSGTYALGDKFPSVREIATEAGVNPNTMQKALAELEQEGLLITNRTSGRFVTDDAGIVEKIKAESAHELVEKFIKNMRERGFSDEEIIKLIEDYLDEKNRKE